MDLIKGRKKCALKESCQMFLHIGVAPRCCREIVALSLWWFGPEFSEKHVVRIV